MASRKRSATSPVEGVSKSRRNRDDRAQRRAAAQDLREQARRDQARRDTIANANAINSPLLRLPGEIRNMVYAYVFDGELYSFIDYSFGSEDNGGKLTSDKSLKKNNMGLLLVSRQVHEETALLPYKMGEFLISIEAPDETEGWECVKAFLEDRSKAQIKAMKRLEIWDSSLWREDYRIRAKKGGWWFATLGCQRD